MLLMFSNTNAVQTPPNRGKLKIWNGSAWVIKPVKVWNGTSWIQKNVRFWNGSAWVYTFATTGYTFFETTSYPGTYSGSAVSESATRTGTFNILDSTKLYENPSYPGTYLIGGV